MKHILLFLSMWASTMALGQGFSEYEKDAEYPGGDEAMYEYLAANLKYPAQAQSMGVEGRVYIQFIVERDGALTHVEVIKGIGAGCDEEAVRVVSGMPKWKPGTQRDEAVRVKMTLPINFSLGNEVDVEEVVEEMVEIEEDVYDVVEELPQFPGGEVELYAYLGSNINYPADARKKGVEGRVYIQYVVAADGAITNVEVVRGIGSGCDEEAARVVREMPNWMPGRHRGKNVAVRFILPITFRLGGAANEEEGQ